MGDLPPGKGRARKGRSRSRAAQDCPAPAPPHSPLLRACQAAINLAWSLVVGDVAARPVGVRALEAARCRTAHLLATGAFHKLDAARLRTELSQLHQVSTLEGGREGRALQAYKACAPSSAS